MLSGEGNAGERWKIIIGLISKKATLHEQQTFLNISLSLFCTTTMWTFQKPLRYTFFGWNVSRVLVHYFFTAAHFHLALVATSISHLHVVLPTPKNHPLLFIFFFSRLASLAFRLLYLFLCLSLKFVDMTINLLSLIV